MVFVRQPPPPQLQQQRQPMRIAAVAGDVGGVAISCYEIASVLRVQLDCKRPQRLRQLRWPHCCRMERRMVRMAPTRPQSIVERAERQRHRQWRAVDAVADWTVGVGDAAAADDGDAGVGDAGDVGDGDPDGD